MEGISSGWKYICMKTHSLQYISTPKQTQNWETPGFTQIYSLPILYAPHKSMWGGGGVTPLKFNFVNIKISLSSNN